MNKIKQTELFEILRRPKITFNTLTVEIIDLKWTRDSKDKSYIIQSDRFDVSINSSLICEFQCLTYDSLKSYELIDEEGKKVAVSSKISEHIL